MPFAAKFWAAMEIPFPGDVVGGFEVEYVDVQHHGIGDGRYEYPISMILRGKGGKQGVRNAVKKYLGAKRTTFSGFGNPYHCWVSKIVVESLGDQRYGLKARGIGVRIFLREELERFYHHLEAEGHTEGDESILRDVLNVYMDAYMKGISRTSAAYKRRIQKIAKAE
jgi:hypothetical protein